jgi:hypothetical protein
MKYPTRIYYTEADKALMWDRWQKGESLNAIARHFGRSHSSIQGIPSRTGGHTSTEENAVPSDANVGRARRDLTRPCGGSLVPFNRRSVATSTVHCQP